MKSKDDVTPVVIFAGNQFDAGLVKTMLEDREITAYFQDDELGMIAPWYAAPGGAGAIKVVVSSADMDAAKAVIDEYYENINRKD
jgi:hypothetical protein